MQTKDLDYLAAIEQLSKLTLEPKGEDVDLRNFKSYNEYAANQITNIPELMLAFLQYDGGDDAMFYMQLVWMSDYCSMHKKQPS